MNNIEILEQFIKHYKEVQEKYKDDEIQAEIERSCYFEEVPAEAIENLIQENKELKEKNSRIKSLDYTALAEEMEMGLWMSKADVEEYYIPIESLNDYIEKSELLEILKQRLKKYQDANDGEYKQEYLTRGELELVDRYKECSELLKILCKEDIYKIKLDYIPKSKVKELAKKYEFALYGYDSSTADYKHSQNLGRYLACVELLKEGE